MLLLYVVGPPATVRINRYRCQRYQTTQTKGLSLLRIVKNNTAACNDECFWRAGTLQAPTRAAHDAAPCPRRRQFGDPRGRGAVDLVLTPEASEEADTRES